MSALAAVRAELRGYAGYSSARAEATQGAVWLNANESPWPPDGDDGLALNRYPQPHGRQLTQALAGLYGVAPEQVLAARGSDECIDLLVRACCRAGADAVLLCPPTFGMYAVSARVQDASVVEVPLQHDPLRGMRPDVAAIIAAARDPRVRLVFACSPNNPTGAAWLSDELARVATAVAGHGLLVVDEAYAEFDGDGRGALPLLHAHPNLVVLRTLSKAHALAGARVGVALAAPELLAVLRAIMAPYPLPTHSQAAAVRALQHDALARTRQQLQLLRAERQRVALALESAGCVVAVLPSAANFLCVRFSDAQRARRQLTAAGVVVRDVGQQPALQDFLRISIGAPADNDRMLSALGAGGVA